MSAGGPGRLRNLIGLDLKHLPGIREKHEIIMHFDGQDHGDTIFFFGRSTDDPLTTAFLHAIHGRIHPLDISVLGQGDDRLLVRDDIFLLEFADASLDDFRPTLIAESVPHFDQLTLHQPEDLRSVLQEVLQISNQFQFFLKFILDLLPFESGEGLQTHLKDSGRLPFGKTEFLHQVHMRLLFVRRLLDGLDDRIDMIERLLESFENMRAILGLLKLIFRPTGHDRLPMLDIVFENRLEIQHLRIHSVHQRQHIHIEVLLKICHGIERVQDLLRICVLLQFDDDPHPVFVRFIAQILDSDYLFLFDQIRNLHDECGLIGLIGHLGNDDLETPGFRFHDIDPGPRDDRALSGRIGMMDIAAVVHDASGRKIRTLDEAHELIDRRIRLVDQMANAIHQFVEIMWRNIGRHTYGDTHSAIQQKLRKFGWENRRLFMHAIEIRNEIDGILLDIQKHLLGDRGKLRFRVAIRSSPVAIHGTEVSLSPDKRIPQRKILRHTDHRVVHRRIAMRVIFSQHFTDHGRRLAEFRAGPKTGRPHRIENTPMHRFQTVAHVRQSTRHDDTHRIIEIRLLDLIRDIP